MADGRQQKKDDVYNPLKDRYRNKKYLICLNRTIEEEGEWGGTQIIKHIYRFVKKKVVLDFALQCPVVYIKIQSFVLI